MWQRVRFLCKLHLSARREKLRDPSYVIVSDVFISRERKCRSGVHPMTFAHNHSRAFRYRFFILSGTFIRWNTWEVRNEYSRPNGVRNSLLARFRYSMLSDGRVQNSQKK